MALKYAGQATELREVSLKDKPPTILRASSKQTVPILIDLDGTVLDESMDIMFWALLQNDHGRARLIYFQATIGG